ncbi:MAG: MBL fold metallo-hydrolase [Candidatus Aminicenantales bacterium]
MVKMTFPFWLITIGLTLLGARLQAFEEDIISTSQGDLRITLIGHATVMFTFGGKTIYVDPISSLADYSQFPKANLILITHDHGDHLDPKAIQTLRMPESSLIYSEKCAEKVPNGIIMKNGDKKTLQGIVIEAVPAYNIVHMRSERVPYHLRGLGNGYVLTFADKRVYVAGDTENIPEMKEIKNIDVAFLPMNLPYTMSPEMAADAARMIRPKVLYPYHYGNTNTSTLVELLKDTKEIEVRIRKRK